MSADRLVVGMEAQMGRKKVFPPPPQKSQQTAKTELEQAISEAAQEISDLAKQTVQPLESVDADPVDPNQPIELIRRLCKQGATK